jgi:hypothetical protein
MSESLFGSTAPALQNEADGVNYALGTRFTPGVNGTISAGKWFFPTTIPDASVQVQIGVYLASGPTLLGSASFPLGSTLGAWNTVNFGSPISVTGGTLYAVVIWTPLRYVATTTYSWPATSTNLTATSSNGWLAVSPGALTYPTTVSGNTASYFADVVFDPLANAPRRVRMYSQARNRAANY